MPHTPSSGSQGRVVPVAQGDTFEEGDGDGDCDREWLTVSVVVKVSVTLPEPLDVQAEEDGSAL